MKISRIKVWGWENAMLGMRFPMNSDALADSTGEGPGPKDLALLLKLTKAGRDHRKALRMLHVQAAIDAPIGFWIQLDTYKVATVANSRSRMHKMGSRLLVREDFHVEQWTNSLEEMLKAINKDILVYQQTGDMAAWRRVIDSLPMSYQQERMWDANYEVLLGLLSARYNEKLRGEWRYFCDTFLDQCPHLRELWETTK